MPNWKKVLTSGSAGELASLYAPSITGSLLGTASFALTASYATQALSSSYAVTASYAATSSFSLATSENRILVINKSGATIAKGVVVHLTGSTNSSDTPYITTASYENDNLSANTLGITAETIAFNSTGFVTTEGVLTGIDVTGFVAGQILYLGADGAILGAAPQAPLHGVRLGQVVRDSPSNNGSIYVRIDNGYELDELHDVRIITASYVYGDLLMRSGSVWTNSRQLTGSYGITGSLTFNNGNGGVTGSLFGTASFATSASFLTSNTNAFIQGGNSFGTTALLGTNDTQNLQFETNGLVRMTVSSSGNVGIGLTTPLEKLHVSGSIRSDIESDGNFVVLQATGQRIHYIKRSGQRLQFTSNGVNTYDVQLDSSNGSVYILSGSVGIGTTTPNAKLDVSGSVIITGSLNVTQNITGSRLLLSASTGTNSGSVLTVYGSGSAQPVFTVQGSQGELFSVTDSLSGSLFSVNDISGLPILEVFSDNTTLIGSYQDPMLITTTKLVTTASGAFTIYSLPTASYDTAFFEYSIRSGSNARAGSIMAIQSASAVNFTETTTTDFGSTAGLAFTVLISGANMLLTGSATTSGWTLKTIIRSI